MENIAMFEVSIDKHDINKVEKFIESGDLVSTMNDFGLDISQMIFILECLKNGISDAKAMLEGETNE